MNSTLPTASNSGLLPTPLGHDLAGLNTETEPAFDEIVQLAAQICEAPFAFVGLADADQFYFKACHGISPENAPGDHTLCDYVRAEGGRMLVVPDTTKDERFRNIACVTGEMGIRFYAGAPLVAPSNQVLGTICVLDRKPHEIRPEQLTALRTLS